MSIEKTFPKTFPKEDWQVVPASAVGMAAEKLAAAKARLEAIFKPIEGAQYRVAIVRHGYLAAEWTHNVDSAEKLHIASANKSILSSMLGIAIAEGKIKSADDPAVAYYPELMDVPPGEGPKEGRWAFPANRQATLRHLICNVSGYMKPDEAPGRVFNYQSNGMCVLSHAIEKAYGLYDVNDPEGSPKIAPLYKEKVSVQPPF